MFYAQVDTSAEKIVTHGSMCTTLLALSTDLEKTGSLKIKSFQHQEDMDRFVKSSTKLGYSVVDCITCTLSRRR